MKGHSPQSHLIGRACLIDCYGDRRVDQSWKCPKKAASRSNNQNLNHYPHESRVSDRRVGQAENNVGEEIHDQRPAISRAGTWGRPRSLGREWVGEGARQKKDGATEVESQWAAPGRGWSSPAAKNSASRNSAKHVNTWVCRTKNLFTPRVREPFFLRVSRGTSDTRTT